MEEDGEEGKATVAGCEVEEWTKETHNGQYNCVPAQATNVIVHDSG